MKIVLLGALSTGMAALEALHTHGGFDVMLISHDNRDASGYAPLFEKALEYGYRCVCTDYNRWDGTIPDGVVFAPDGINSTEAIRLMYNFAPDIGLCMGWSSLLKRNVLAVPTHGWIGHHESLLPKGRGRAPIVWPILHGNRSTGVSFFWLTEGVDDGDIFAQRVVPILPDDYAGDLLRRCDKTTKTMLLEDVLPKLSRKEFVRIPQNHDLATYTHRRTPDMGLIDWTKPAAEVCRFIRALSYPYPGAFTYNKLAKIHIWRTDLRFDNNRPSRMDMFVRPGQTAHFATQERILEIRVECGDGNEIVLRDFTGKIELHDRLGCWPEDE